MKLRQPLFRKYLKVLTGLISLTLVLATLLQLGLSVAEQRQRAGELLDAEARTAALQIDAYLAPIVGSMGWVLDFDLPGQEPDLVAIRDESLRLLHKSAAIMRARYVTGGDCQRLNVSRVDVDRQPACVPLAAHDAALVAAARSGRVAYGGVRYHEGSAPYLDIAVGARGRQGGVLLAEVDLRQIHATVSAIRVGATGFAYVLDPAMQLVAHPDASLVLRKLNLQDTPAVRDAVNGGAVLTTDRAGRYVLSATAPVAGPRWRVFVQQPAREAFGPIERSLWAALLVLLLALAGAAAASFVLARRMASPILAVRAGAEKIGAGQLDTRITINSGDEVELLAHEFNSMAATLGHSYASLETKVQARTAELASASAQLTKVNGELSLRLDELAVRKDEAERASAAKTRFLAAASHDLMQPMHAVGLLVGILRQRVHAPETSDLVHKVQSAVQGMENLFAGLLDVSKLDSNAVKVDLRTVDMASLLQFIENNYQPLAQEKGIRLRVLPCRAAVRTDPGLLDRILGNLVTNAIRYTPPGGKVLVGCRRLQGVLRIDVLDTGVGIAPQFKAQIFEEFFQIENMERDRSNGLGLGLSIVKRSAALLGHPLSLQSHPGRGSVFGITVPAVARQPAAEPAPAQLTDMLHGAFVVAVDDDSEARFAMEQLLHMWGCHALVSSTRDDVLIQLEQHLRPPDLIVTDMRLGKGVTGLDVIAAIREQTGELTPAVIVTGESELPPQTDWPPCCQIVRKPVGPARLQQLCQHALAGEDELTT
jgi:signal transduction histidine kinase/CheY-like chemotaxis protein